MNIRHLMFFLTICELGSINKASSQLFISPQGLNRIVRNLELELGVQLFIRTAQGIRLTPQGKVAQKYAEKIVSSASELKEELGLVEEQARSQVLVVCAYAVLEQLDHSFFNLFRLKNCDIDLITGEYPYPIAERLVQEGKFDLGLGFTPINTAKFDYVKLKHSPWPLLVHRSSPLAQKGTITCADLAGQNFFMMSSSFKSHETFQARCRELGLYPNVVGMVNNLAETYQLVKENQGAAFSHGRIDDPDVAVVYLDDEKCCSDLVMFIRKGMPLNEDAQRFYDYALNFSREHWPGEQ